MRYSNENKSKANGVVYTPSEMADYVARLMLRYADKNESTEVSILDPAVGEGELLVAMINAVKSKCSKLKVVGYETDQAVGEVTQSKLSEMFPEIDVEIRIGDFLAAVDDGSAGKYDYVIANPPYIRTQIMGSDKAQEIAEKLSLTGRVDIYYAFLVCTKDVLKEHGIAGYITEKMSF